jgi:hypothetical protein
MALSKTYVLPLDPQMGCSNLDTAFRRESVDLTSIYFDVRVPAFDACACLGFLFAVHGLRQLFHECILRLIVITVSTAS